MDEISTYPYAGLDTEFYNCSILTESPAARSVCHVFSVATPSGPLLPRGFNEATSYVFDGRLLNEACVKEWLENAEHQKPVHNQSVDAHTIRNHGVTLRGGVNTLAMARFWYPSRAKREGFDLDSLGRDFCGSGKTESYDDLLGYDDTEEREHTVTKKRCECGAISCRKRLGGHDRKTPVELLETYRAKVRRRISLTLLEPGHPLWTRYLAYAAWDAVLALWIYQYMLRDKIERPYPWQITL